MTLSIREAHKLVGHPKDAKKSFVKILKKISYDRGLHEAFDDFCTMARIALMQPFYRSVELEKQYMGIIGKYKHATAQLFPELLALTVIGLDMDSGSDFLGAIAQELEIVRGHGGQFFTPPSLTRVIAKMTMRGIGDAIRKQGFVEIQEPAVGPGGMVLAVGEIVREEGFEPARTVWFDVWDVNHLMASICYIQMSLTALAGRVTWGNTLKMEAYQQWYTSMFFLERWDQRLKSRRMVEQMKQALEGFERGPRPVKNPQMWNYLQKLNQARHDYNAAMTQLASALHWHVEPEMLRDYMRSMHFKFTEAARAENVMDFESAGAFLDEVLEMAKEAMIQLNQSNY